jgi:hypothetical protein
MPAIIRTPRGLTAAAALALLVAGVPARGDAPASARDAVSLVTEAAHAWRPDATLVYLENDEPLAGDGRAERWGYVFTAPGAPRARVYSVKDGKIVVADYLGFDFDAPPLPDEWIDSPAALAAADEKAQSTLKDETGASPGTLLLVRGAIDDKKPDVTTWTVVYTVPDHPSLFVVVDAGTGKVLRTWRG